MIDAQVSTGALVRRKKEIHLQDLIGAASYADLPHLLRFLASSSFLNLRYLVGWLLCVLYLFCFVILAYGIQSDHALALVLVRIQIVMICAPP